MYHVSAAVDGESIDNVPDFPFIIHCRWRSSGRSRDDIAGYIATVDCRQNDTSSDSAKSSASLVETVTVTVQCVNRCLSARGINCRAAAGLRAFVHTDWFSATDLCQG